MATQSVFPSDVALRIAGPLDAALDRVPSTFYWRVYNGMPFRELTRVDLLLEREAKVGLARGLDD